MSVTYLIAECPFDGYVWRVRGTDEKTGELLEGYSLPKSCPRCKKRFDTAWASAQLRTYKKMFKNYRELLMFLNEKNRSK